MIRHQLSRKYYRSLIYSLVLLLLVVYSGKTQTSNSLSVEATVDTQQALIGDWIVLTVVAQHPSSLHVQWPLVGDSIGPFEVLKRTPYDTIMQKGKRSIKRQYTLIIFDSGKYHIPALPFLTSPSQTPLDTTYTSPIPIRVHSMRVDTAQQIKSIKPPLSVPLTFAEIWPYIAGGIVIILLIATGWYIYSKRKHQPLPTQKIAAPSLPPHQEAFDALYQLEKEKMWQRGEVKEFYVRLSYIMRRYLERRYQVKALEVPTGELLGYLRQKISLDRSLRQNLQQMLETADFAKFAKYEPTTDENYEWLQEAYQFVKTTRPRVKNDGEASNDESNSTVKSADT